MNCPFCNKEIYTEDLDTFWKDYNCHNHPSINVHFITNFEDIKYTQLSKNDPSKTLLPYYFIELNIDANKTDFWITTTVAKHIATLNYLPEINPDNFDYWFDRIINLRVFS